MRTREEKLTWLHSLEPDAQRAMIEWPGMRVAVCLAQAALESSFGERCIGQGNLWGIKRLAWVPGVIKVRTKEWVDGEFISCEQEFSDFPSVYEGMRCYGRLMTNSPRYELARKAVDLEDYVAEVSKNWATDPLYRKKVWTLIQLLNLEKVNG